MKKVTDIFAMFDAFAAKAGPELFVGVDPGVTGAMSFYDGTRAIVLDIPIVATRSMTTWKGKRHKKTSRQSDDTLLAKFFKHVKEVKPATILVVERGQPQPTDTAVTGFSVGCSYEAWRMLSACLTIEILFIRPVQWKNICKLLGQDKEASRQMAIAEFPALLPYLNTKSSHNRAESLLLAKIGRQLILAGRQEKEKSLAANH